MKQKDLKAFINFIFLIFESINFLINKIKNKINNKQAVEDTEPNEPMNNYIWKGESLWSGNRPLNTISEKQVSNSDTEGLPTHSNANVTINLDHLPNKLFNENIIKTKSLGAYEEDLPCGGKLRVMKNSWKIEYYFSGPDLRYNGDLFTINEHDIDNYISAYVCNWDTFSNLKAIIPCGSEFSQDGKMGMTIRIGNFCEGICIKNYHLPIGSEPELKSLISGFLYSKARSKVIQKLLQNI